MAASTTVDLNRTLMKFYNEAAKADPQSHSSLLCSAYTEAIIRIVGERDNRFIPKNITRVGSTASGVSAIITQEMDHLLLMNIKGTVIDIPKFPGYANFKIDESRSVVELWKDLTNNDGYLDTRKVALRVNELVKLATEVMKKNPPEGMETLVDTILDITISDDLSAATTISGNFGPSDWTFGNFKSDIVPVISCDGFPPTIMADWTLRIRRLQWPTQSDIDTITATGYGLVAKHIFEGDCEDKDLLSIMWRYSTSRAETILFQNMESRSVCKILLVILKAIRLYEIPEKIPPITPVLTSYHMKTVVLHEALEHPDPGDWRSEALGERYLSVLNRLKTCICNKTLPHFFFPTVNLFRGVEGGFLAKIEGMIANPGEYIEKLMERRKNPFPVFDWISHNTRNSNSTYK